MTLPVGPDEETTLTLFQVRQFTSRLGVTGLGQAATFATGLANQVVLARALGVDTYGQYALVGASAALLGWFLGLGLNVATPALVRGEASRARTVVQLAGAYLALLGGVAGAAFWLLPPSVSTALSPNLAATAGRWLFPTTVLALSFLIALGLLLGLGTFAGHAIVSLVNSVILLALNFRLLALPPGARLEPALLNLNASYASAVAVAVVMLAQRGALGSGVSWRTILAERSGSTLRIYVCNVMRLGLLRAPFYVIDRLLGTRALGLYALADYLMNLLWRPAGIAGQVLLASASIDRDATGPRVVAWLSRVLSAATACALLGLALLGKGGVAAVFGPAFGDAYPVLLAAAPGIWAYSVVGAVDYYYAAHDYPWTLGIAFALGAVTTVIGSLLVAGSAGLVGVAAAYGVSLGLAFLVIDGSFVRKTGVPWSNLVLPRRSDWSAIAAVLMRRAHKA